MKRKLFILAYSFILITFSAYAQIDWMKQNYPIVKQYMLSLPDSMIDKSIGGLELTDSKIILNKYIYLGKLDSLSVKTHIYFFKKDKKYYVYLWVDKDGKTFKLPEPLCNDGKSIYEWTVIYEEVYTYVDLFPNGDIVYSACPPKKWLELLSFTKNKK